MENHQNTQQQLAELSDAKQIHSEQRLDKSTPANLLLKLIRHYPWLVWMGVSTFLAAVITISASSIIRTDYVKNQAPAPTPVVEINPTKTSAHNRSSTSVWFMSVVFGGAVGAVAIAKRLQKSSQFSVPRIRQRFQPSRNRALTRRQQRKLLLQGKQLPPALGGDNLEQEIKRDEKNGKDSTTTLDQNKIQLASVPVTTAAEPALPSQENQPPRSATELLSEVKIDREDKQPLNLAADSKAELPAQVTVIPPEADKTLNCATESLAEMMDIRKKIPLSAILSADFSAVGDRKQQTADKLENGGS